MRCPRLLRLLIAPLGSRRAATAVEYGLICGLIVIGMLVAIRGLASATVGMWSNINSDVRDAQ